MTEFMDEPRNELSRDEWEKILGHLDPKEYYPGWIQHNPGLVTVTIDGVELCPLVQFVPGAKDIQLYPKLTEGWALARQCYGAQDPDGLVTATIFATPVRELKDVCLFDVLTSDDAEQMWEQARDLIVAAYPRTD